MSILNEKDDAPVHIDFVVEQADLFRASLDQGKRRLLVGVGVVAVFTLGLIYFFVMIGEQNILLKLSPLFIGLPIFGVAGQVLRAHAACRKYVSGLSESQRRIQYMFKANVDGYDVLSGESFSHVGWTDVLKVVERSSYFLIYANRYEASILPKRGFHQESDIPRFKNLVRDATHRKTR